MPEEMTSGPSGSVRRSEHVHRRLRAQIKTFCCLYVGYTVFVICRSSFTFVMPILMDENGLSKKDLGIVTSSLLLSYTFSKFYSGAVVADSHSSKGMLCLGLGFTGLTVSLFSVSSTVWVFALLWFINGLAQGGSWIACAKIMKKWYPATVFGTLWGVLSTSMNTARALGPPLASVVAANYGWRTFFQLMGVSCFILLCVFYIFLQNSPEDCGLSETETTDGVAIKEMKTNRWLRLRDLLKFPFLWVHCLVGLAVAVTRSSMYDWGQLYLIQEKSQSNYTASSFLVSEEVGGLLGSIMAGYLADRAVANQRISGGSDDKNPRLFVMNIFLFLSATSLYLFLHNVDGASPKWWIYFVGGLMGFFNYGTIAIFGIVAIEIAPDHLSAKSSAIAEAATSLGYTLAGYPVTYFATMYSWRTTFIFLQSFVSVMLIVSLLTSRLPNKLAQTKKAAKED